MKEYERTQFQFPELKRYYDTIQYRLSPVNAVIGADVLLSELPFPTAVTTDKLERHDLLPYEGLYDQEPQTVKDRLALMPLIALEYDLERSSLDLWQSAQWYEEVVRLTVRASRDRHGAQCVDAHCSADNLLCKYDSVCPWRYMQRALGNVALEQDFDSDMYQLNPERSDAFVDIRLAVAERHGILTPEWCETARAHYQARADHHRA